jgi:DNA (cytosine-5)-methyltransferase 1
MQDIWIKKIGSHRGAPRLFLDAAQAVRAGFCPGERFEVRIEGHGVVLTKLANGARIVSARRKDDEVLPVIDINSKELLGAFEGMHSVRVVVGKECVYILPLASELKKRERLSRVTGKLARGEALSTGSLAHGGGVLSHAIHQGLHDAGVDANLVFVNELREDLIEHACRVNDAWTSQGPGRTAALVVPMQEAVQDEWLMGRLPLLEVLEMGLPCSGASRAGVAKRGLAKMEDHPGVGHLVFAALVFISKTQPAVVLLENVVDYRSCASAQILRQQLQDMGYDLHEAVLEGADFGALENRVRWVLVAVTHGVEFDFDRLQPTARVVTRLRDVLDDVADDDPRWSEMSHLLAKQERDRSKGSNFKMQVLTEEATSVGTLRKGYHKGGSTDPVLRHPTQEHLMRRLSAAEHARVKGVPDHLIESLSQTQAHQLLGQGIVYEPFRAVGQRIGVRLRQAAQRLQPDHDVVEMTPDGGLVGQPPDEEPSQEESSSAVSWRRTRMVG